MVMTRTRHGIAVVAMAAIAIFTMMIGTQSAHAAERGAPVVPVAPAVTSPSDAGVAAIELGSAVHRTIGGASADQDTNLEAAGIALGAAATDTADSNQTPPTTTVTEDGAEIELIPPTSRVASPQSSAAATEVDGSYAQLPTQDRTETLPITGQSDWTVDAVAHHDAKSAPAVAPNAHDSSIAPAAATTSDSSFGAAILWITLAAALFALSFGIVAFSRRRRVTR